MKDFMIKHFKSVSFEHLRDLERKAEEHALLLAAAKHAVMEWRLHGQLTDSCRGLEAAIEKAEKKGVGDAVKETAGVR